jgi:hypothetical protein
VANPSVSSCSLVQTFTVMHGPLPVHGVVAVLAEVLEPVLFLVARVCRGSTDWSEQRNRPPSGPGPLKEGPASPAGRCIRGSGTHFGLGWCREQWGWRPTAPVPGNAHRRPCCSTRQGVPVPSHPHRRTRCTRAPHYHGVRGLLGARTLFTHYLQVSVFEVCLCRVRAPCGWVTRCTGYVRRHVRCISVRVHVSDPCCLINNAACGRGLPCSEPAELTPYRHLQDPV